MLGRSGGSRCQRTLLTKTKATLTLGCQVGNSSLLEVHLHNSALCWPLVAIVALTVSRRCAAADASLFFDAELLSAEEGPQVIWATPGGGVELPI